MDLPPAMQQWASVYLLFTLDNENLASMHFNNVRRSIKDGSFKLEGHVVTMGELDTFMDFVRPTINFAIPPSSTIASTWSGPRLLSSSQQQETLPFSWRYWDLPIPWLGDDDTQYNLFPLPVAVFDIPLRNQKCLVSATALWHLFPNKNPVSCFFAVGQRTSDRWHVWSIMGIHADEVKAPPKSASAKQRVKPSDGLLAVSPIQEHQSDTEGLAEPADQSTPKFSQYMISPRMLLGMACWMAHVPRASEKIQDALFALVKTISDALPRSVQLPVGKADGGCIPSEQVRNWLVVTGSQDLWTNKKVYKVCPDLAGPHVPTEWCIWFMVRNWAKNEKVLADLVSLIDIITPLLDTSIAERSHQTLPTMRLPSATSESYTQIRKALRGDDKVYLAFNSFLSRSVGFGKEDDHALRSYIYSDHLTSYNAYVIRSLVAAYFTKARTTLADIMGKNKSIAGDFVYFDASRVASKEILLMQAWTEGMFLCLPLQCLPDQTSVHAPEAAVDNVSEVILPLVKRPRTGAGRPRRRAGEATQSLLFSIVQSMKVVFPIGGLGTWAPSSAPLGGHEFERKWCGIEGQPFYWNKEDHSSVWCLPDELRNVKVDEVDMRLLVVVADEGSTGWSLLQWMALRHGLRVFWQRDPLHRLSNLFTNSLRGVPGVLSCIMKHLIVHKWRRAPFGSGKFWRALQESLGLVLERCSPSHPIYDLLYESICADHDLESSSPDKAHKILQSIKKVSLGPKVQMRRWFTIWDAGWGLDSLWHSLLFGVVVTYAMDGVDAWKLAGEVVPVVQKGDSKDVQQYKYKQQVLIVLMDPANQRLLRSMLHTFKRIRMHQKAYTEEATNPQACLRYNILWSNVAQWLDQIVVPSMRDGLCDITIMERLRLTGNVTAPSPLLAPLESEGDDAAILYYHTRLVMEMAWQSILYVTQPSTPPFSFCRLLDNRKAVRLATLAELRDIWKLTLTMERSSQPALRKMLGRMPFTRWVVYREVMTLLEVGGWTLESPSGQLARMYVVAMFSGNQHTLALENGFNDLRDNEGRGARHKARSEQVLQGLSLSSMATRYGESAPLLHLSSSDISGHTKTHVKNDVFMGGKAATTADAIGLDPRSLVDDRKSWPSTSPLFFSNNQLALLHVLRECPKDKWPDLWLAGLMRQHMVISKPDKNQVWYIVGVRPHSVVLLELECLDKDGDGLVWHLHPRRDAFRLWTPITDMGEYRCHSHTLLLRFSPKAAKVCVQLDDRGGQSMAGYCCAHYIHLLRLDDLKLMAKSLDVHVPRATNHLGYVEAILDHEGVDGDEKERVLKLVEERLARRKRRATKSTGVEEGADVQDDDADQADDELQEDMAEANPFMRSLPEEEVAFAFNAIPAGMALDEEEGDEGLDEIAKASGYVRDESVSVASSTTRTTSLPTASGVTSTSVPSSSSGLTTQPQPSEPSPPMVPPHADPPTSDAIEMPASVDSTSIDEERLKLACTVRCPNLDEVVQSLGCSLRLYPASKTETKLRWQAKLPPWAGMFEGTKSKSSSFERGESGDLNKLICYNYLQRWYAKQSGPAAGGTSTG